MSMRLGAALCGAAFMFCCPSFVNAKLAANGPSTEQRSADKGRTQHSNSSRVSQDRPTPVATTKPARHSEPSVAETVVGQASTYNPLRPEDSTAGGLQTASGEDYNPEDW